MKDIVLVGYGGHAKSVTDSIERTKEYNIVGYTDVKKVVSEYTFLGTDDVLKDLFESGIHNAVITIGNIGDSTIRIMLAKRLKEIGFELPIIVDSSAVIARDVHISEGTYVGKGAIINAGSSIGACCIINTGSIIEHECIISDYAHVSVGSAICGQVRIGTSTFIGANATICQCLNIGDNVVVGAGAVVIDDLPSFSKAVGVPARIIEKKEK